MGVERSALRILMTADTAGGVWRFALELAARLAGDGDRVLLAVTGGGPDAAQRREVEAIAGVELQARPYRLVWMAEPWRDLAAGADWLLALAGRFAPDVIHLNDLAAGEQDWPAPVLTTAHSCVCSWWRAVHGEPAPARWNRYRAHVLRSLRESEHVVAPTRAMLEALTREHGELPSTQVIANGRHVNAHAAPKEPLVLAAGRLWDEAKNLGALAGVAPLLPWPVYLAGEARHPDGSGRAAVENVRLLGRLDDAALAAWMTRAAIYALPARYEPFGLSVLEAAAHGCALVLGDIPSLREVWGDAALFVPPDDRDALAAALGRLTADGRLRETMAARAQARSRRYPPESMAAQYRDAYLRLKRAGRIAPRPVAPPPRTAVGSAA